MQQQHQATTPFGRRTLSLAHVAAQITARERPPEAVVHKWRIFRDLCAARERAGVSDRALAVLNALLSFHQETALTGDDLVVFPSNRQLSLRANGMAPSTLRRHIANLVDRGLVIRRDSPNGKRFARKGPGGNIEQAFGFDLSPLVARGAQIEAWAEEARAEDHAVRLARERLTLRRRDIAKMIETGIGEGVTAPAPGGWVAVHARFRDIVGAVPRVALAADLELLADALAALAGEIRIALETHVIQLQTSCSESQGERHIQNSKSDDINDIENVSRTDEHAASLEANDYRQLRVAVAYPISMVIQACPDVVDYAKRGVRSWHDLVAVADLVRSALGISPSAWHEAQQVLGSEAAAIVIACILQRAEAISAPGGYLRNLVSKAREGRFSVGPMLMALLRTRGQEGRRMG